MEGEEAREVATQGSSSSIKGTFELFVRAPEATLAEPTTATTTRARPVLAPPVESCARRETTSDHWESFEFQRRSYKSASNWQLQQEKLGKKKEEEEEERRRSATATTTTTNNNIVKLNCELPKKETSSRLNAPPASQPANNNNSSLKSSYSKLFRQYLPNLNYKQQQQQQLDDDNNNNKQQFIKQPTSNLNPEQSTRSKQQTGKADQLSSSLITNAFGRFRLSPTPSSSSPISNFKPSKQSSSAGGHISSANEKFLKAKGQSLLESFENSESAAEDKKLVRRKGFLYLKKSKCIESAAGGGINKPLVVLLENREKQSNQVGHPQGKLEESESWVRGKKSLPSTNNKKAFSAKQFKRDLNNNSLSSFISSNCTNNNNYNKCHDGQKSCLLLEEEEGEEEEESEKEKEVEKGKEGRRIVEELSRKFVARGQMSAVRGEQRTTIMSTKHQPHKKSSSKGGSSSPLLLAGACLLAATLTLLLISSALAQQQQQPFSRSQSGGSLTPAALPSPPQSQGLPPPNSPQQQQSSASGSQRLAPNTPQSASGSLVANINCNKIRGHVTLTPNLRGGTTVSTQISAGPAGEVYQWSVHQFPVKPGAAMCSCSPLILGTKLIDLSEMHGNLPSEQEFSVQSSLNLFGSDSPVGHSVMLRGMKTGMTACATFLPTSRKSNYRAKFHTPLSGSVTIFQTAFGTSFIGHLMYSNGTRRHSMHRFDLVKSEDDIVAHSLLGGVQAGSANQSPNSRADNFALEQREHEQELSQCRRFTNGEALFKNITYQLAVSTENFGMRGRTAMVLPQIPFETFSSIYVVVYSEHDPSEPIACAPLKFVKPKTAAAKFQTVSVQGSVLFSQDSPYDVTVARINLNMPNSDGHSYGIDELPMIIRRKSDTRVCPNIREIIYNPHHVEPSSVPLEGEATSDQYAVGDLSGKYGSLTGKASEKITVNDFNLPLFGPISIVGRAMTIYSAEGVAIACSNIELTTPMTTAFATFDYGIQGQFIFRQPVNDCNGDTYVYIEVSKPVSSQSSPLGGATAATSPHQHNGQAGANQDHSRSLDHNWHIHVNPVDSGLDHLSTTDCLPAGPHYNPYNTSTASIYSRDCTPFNVLRCELGDLSAKMFTIDIPPYRVKGGQEPDIGKFFGTDIDLPLCGPVSVVNRSVVVHVQDFGLQRLACSTVIEFKPRAS